jgi:hypothetical protein
MASTKELTMTVRASDTDEPCGWAHAAKADSELWLGLCDTREEAILDGYDTHTDPTLGGSFFVARAHWNTPNDGLGVDSVIDSLLDYVYDNHGDFAYEALDVHITEDARAELDALLNGWAQKYLSKRYYGVGAPEEIRRADVATLERLRTLERVKEAAKEP